MRIKPDPSFLMGKGSYLRTGIRLKQENHTKFSGYHQHAINSNSVSPEHGKALLPGSLSSSVQGEKGKVKCSAPYSLEYCAAVLEANPSSPSFGSEQPCWAKVYKL